MAFIPFARQTFCRNTAALIVVWGHHTQMIERIVQRALIVDIRTDNLNATSLPPGMPVGGRLSQQCVISLLGARFQIAQRLTPPGLKRQAALARPVYPAHFRQRDALPDLRLHAVVLQQAAFFRGEAALRRTVYITKRSDSDIVAAVLGSVNPLHKMLAKHPDLRFIQMLTTMIGDRGINTGRNTNAGISIQWRYDNFQCKQRQFLCRDKSPTFNSKTRSARRTPDKRTA